MGTPGALSWLQDGTVHLVYGILEEPVRSLEAINTSGLQTGLQRVQLLKPNISVPALPADLQTMEIRAPDILVPGQETTYWCYITKLPEGFSRHHIVMVRAVGAGVCVGGTAPGHVLLPALPPPWGPGELSVGLLGPGDLYCLDVLQPHVCSGPRSPADSPPS